MTGSDLGLLVSCFVLVLIVVTAIAETVEYRWLGGREREEALERNQARRIVRR